MNQNQKNKIKLIIYGLILIGMYILFIGCNNTTTPKEIDQSAIEQSDHRASIKYISVVLDTWKIVCTIKDGKRNPDSYYFVGYIENKGRHDAKNITITIYLGIGENEEVEKIKAKVSELRSRNRKQIKIKLTNIKQIAGIYISKYSILWS